MMFEEPKYMNGPNKCMVCFKGFTNDDPRVKHHIRYYPELIANVHYSCHKKIHDPDNPLTVFIQYTRQDSIDFYQEKREAEANKPNNNVILE